MSLYVVSVWFLSPFGYLTDFVLPQNYDFPNNCEDYIHRIGRTGVSHALNYPMLFLSR